MGVEEIIEIIGDALGALPGKLKDDEEECKNVDCVDCYGKGVCGKKEDGTSKDN